MKNEEAAALNTLGRMSGELSFEAVVTYLTQEGIEYDPAELTKKILPQLEEKCKAVFVPAIWRAAAEIENGNPDEAIKNYTKLVWDTTTEVVKEFLAKEKKG